MAAPNNTTPPKTAYDVYSLPGVSDAMEDAAGRPAPFLGVAEETPGAYGWHFYVLDVTNTYLVLSYVTEEWTDWRAASAGHRMIEQGYIISPPAHFEDHRTAGWAPLPGGRWSAPLHVAADFANKAPTPGERHADIISTPTPAEKDNAQDQAEG